jgi:VIT1/CCC1 family predicted Fe2+/Mn2+ transporter
METNRRDDVAMGLDEHLDGVARKVAAERDAQLETAKKVLLPLFVKAAIAVLALAFWRYEIGLPLSIGAAILTIPAMGIGVALPIGYMLGKRTARHLKDDRF